MSLIIDTVFSHLPYKRKTTPSGWISFNAVCCHHMGTGQDNRQRGGIILNGDHISYHCFNCGFKTSWQSGRMLTLKFKKFLHWINVSDDLISKCSFESLKLKDELEKNNYASLIPKFDNRELPELAKPLTEWAKIMEVEPAKELVEKYLSIINYVVNRGFDNPFDFDFYWSPNYIDRVIIPFRYQGLIVGYTARRITDHKPKYISEQQPGYVFNFDNQNYERKFIIVSEGPFDAISIDGVAILGSELNSQQISLINSLNKEVIVVPDRDHEGPKIVAQAIEQNWSVSFPDWSNCKDINDSIVKYGKLRTLSMILSSKHKTALKIRLYSKQWFKGERDD